MAQKKSKSKVPAIHAARLAACRQRMADANLSAYLIVRRADTFYMTGFTGEDSAVLMTSRAVHIITDGRFDEDLKSEAPWATRHMRKGMLIDEIAKVVRRLKMDRIGVQAESMTVSDFESLRRAVRPVRLVKAPAVIQQLRRCKDASEVAILRKAIIIAEEAFKAMRKTVRVGQSEFEMAATLEYEMRKRGSSGVAFSTICAVDANASKPHAHTGQRKVKKGSAVLFDWGATVGFYRSDLTRVLFVGRIPPRLRKIYNVVLEAQLAAIETVRPGARACDVDAVARKVIESAGFGKQFVHSLGHGLGLDVHEAPQVSWRSDEPLAEGMVVTVEPGIYLPGVGGVRIEDDVLVTAGGHTVLSTLDKDLKGAVV